jgi:arylsulfatase A-like enzyme
VLVDAASGDVSGEPDWFRAERGYSTDDQPGELYDLADDPSQRTNRYADRPAKVEELRTLLESYVEEGRSVPPQ